MSASTRKLVSEYLSRYGWVFDSSKQGGIESGWQGESIYFSLSIDCYQHWIAFRVNPFPELNIDWESWPEIARYLLEWNDGSHVAKLSLDAAGIIQINADLLVDNLDFDAFSQTLGTISHYAERLYDDLLTFLDHVGFRYCESLNILT